MYDLGDDDRFLSLPYVNVSDGRWHAVKINRYANQVILRMDNGEGKYYAESYPDNRFREIDIHPDGVFGAARVTFNEFSQAATVEDTLVDSCLSDVRLDQNLFPMDASDNGGSALADVVQSQSTVDQCLSNACDGVICPVDMMCLDRWKMPFCM